LVDLVQIHGIASLGAGAKLEATRLVGWGFLFYGGYGAGLANRGVGAWREVGAGIGLPPVMNFRLEMTEGAPGGFVSGSYEASVFGEQAPEYEHDSTVPYDWLTLRATVVLFLGVDCELRVNQLGDFVVGVFGRDPLSDDAGSEESQRAWEVHPISATWDASSRRAAARFAPRCEPSGPCPGLQQARPACVISRLPRADPAE